MARAPRTPDRLSLWLLTIAPMIWMSHLLLCYGTVAVWCGKFASSGGALNGVAAAIGWYTAIALVALVVIAWEGFQRHLYVATGAAAGAGRQRASSTRFETGGTEATTHDLDAPEDRHRFLGFATLLLAGLSAIGVLYAALAATFFETCR